MTEAAAKHTPGPWKVIAEKGELDDSYWIGPEKHFSIAQIRHGAEDEEYGGPEAEFANSVLIAKAPEMLEALRYIHNHCHELWAQENYRSGIAYILDRTGPLIEEITGEAP